MPESFGAAIQSITSSGYFALAASGLAVGISVICAKYVDEFRNRGTRLVGELSARWPAIDLALDLVEREADDFINELHGGRYLPVYQVAKQVFEAEGFEGDDLLQLAALAMREFDDAKYKSLSPSKIDPTARRIGESVGKSILSMAAEQASKVEPST